MELQPDRVLFTVLIPYSTDAPIYHYPLSTVTMIVVNVVFFFCFCLPTAVEEVGAISHFVDESGKQVSVQEAEESTFEALEALTPVYVYSFADRLKLQFGEGYLPWQWLTSMFMHADFMHLLGNMIFLWAFGLLLEGKLGWLKFTLAYLSTGIFQAFIVQTLMWFSHGAALGASGALFSMLALVVLFAPLNSFEVLMTFGFRFFTFELPILTFGFLYVAMNVTFYYFGGELVNSEGLHLLGFLVGLPVGWFMLTRGLVDCEGYDLISHLTGREGARSKVGKAARRQRTAKREARESTSAPPQNPAHTLAILNKQIDEALAQKQFDLAVALQNKISESYPEARWTQPRLGAVVQHFVKAQDFAKAIPLMELHITLFDQHRFLLQSKIVKIYLQQQRPRQAIRYMQSLNPAFLSETEKTEFRQLAAQAKKQIQDGVLELE